jgi:D-alanyl-D-alanine carboxypeptidase
MPDISIYEVIHTSPELRTVYDYVLDSNSPAFNYSKDLDAFLKVKNRRGKTNREVIENSYNTNEEKALKGEGAQQLILKIGTRLAIEPQKVNKAGLLTQGLEITDYDIPAFKARALADLESNENYKHSKYVKFKDDFVHKGSVKISVPDITVWVWCRALANKNNNFEGEILNLTPFITNNLSTDVDRYSGGSFSFTLPPLVCELGEDDKWIIKKNNLQFYKKEHLSLQKTDFLAKGALYEKDGDELKRNGFLFHTILSSQDLVFIRFETLALEQIQRINEGGNLNIPKTSLPNRIYDMIGLIDTNGIKIDGSKTDVTIDINGRDLCKLFLDDGAYVFNLELSQGMLGGPGSTATSGLSKRLIEDKSLQYLGLYFNNSIEKIIKFVFNQLSTIKVIPDTLLDAYIDEDGNDRRNQIYGEDRGLKDRSAEDKEFYRKVAKDLIANVRELSGLTKQINEEKIAINAAYVEFHRFLKEMRSTKARIVQGNETADWLSFDYINDQGITEAIEFSAFPIYLNENIFNVETTSVGEKAKEIVAAIDKVIDIEQAIVKKRDATNTQPAPGIWQIIKLALDTGVTNRKVIDSSLSTANGSLMNFLKKACQEPFVELIMDTYGDMYYLTVRKPPTDRKGILSLLEAKVTVEGKNDNVKTNTPNSERTIAGIIDIEPDDVIDEELSFDDADAISWYHLQPQSSFLGGDQVSLAYLPAIFLPEYADIWGSKPLQLQHNYLPTIYSDTDKNSLDIIQKQAIEDLRYIIESNAYLPFTRKGIIKTNGDRRYKVGNLVRFKPTGEIFHIDHVKQDYVIHDGTIDRTSTIVVSRGMVEQLIYGIPDRSVEGDNNYISYFNIVNTKPVYDYSNITTYREETVKVGQKKIVTSNNQSTPADGVSFIDPSSLSRTNQNLGLLLDYPLSTRSLFTKFIYEINKLGYSVIVVDGIRTYSQQLALFNKRDKDHPAAAPGSKNGHEAGRAMDINVIGKGITLKKFSPKSAWVNAGIVTIANQLGLEWGGNFNDNNHFQLRRAVPLTTTTYEDTYETKRIPIHEKSLDIGKVFSNFRVNKEVFNFFLRREQLSSQYVKVKSPGVYTDGGIKSLSEVTIKSKK